ncbi:ATP-binding protein [Wenyingzhuangia sp. IMCC45467]
MKIPFINFLTVNFFKRYIFIFFILGLFCFSFYWLYNDVKKNTIDEFNKEQLILAKTASQGINSFWDNYQSNLLYIVKNNDFVDFSEKEKKSLNHFYDTHKNVIKAITKVDAKGIIEYSYPTNNPVIGKDISHQEHVKEILQSKKTVISDVFMSAQGYYAIAMHVPIFNNTQYTGSLAVLIPIDKMGELFLDNIKSNKKGVAWLITENDKEIYCPIEEHQGKSILKTTHNDDHTKNMLNEIKKSKSGTGKSIHTNYKNLTKNTEEMYVVYYRVPHGNTFWTILISYQESEVYLALSSFRNKLLIIFVLFLTVTSYYIYSLIKARNVLREESKRKKAEKLLRESNDRFNSFMENTPIYAYIKDKSFHYIYQNKTIDSVIDYNNIENLFNKETIEILKNADQKILLGEKESLELVFSTNINGKKRWFKDLKFVIKNAKNKNNIGGVMLDITEIKDYQKKLEYNKLNLEKLVNKRTKDLKSVNKELQIQKEEVETTLINLKETQSRLLESEKMASLGVLTAGVSHEINNPLQYLTGVHYALTNYFNKYKSNDIATTSVLLSSIEIAINRISSIVEGLNQLSNDTNLIDKKCNLHSIIDNCVAILTNQKNAAITFDKKYDSKKLTIKGKTNKLHQAFINIISNAIQSIPAKGKITIVTQKNKDSIIIDIIDTGSGINKKDLPKIIDPFFTTKDPGEGIGLGLSIAYNIIKDHNGQIYFNSEINKGTKATIILPLNTKL